MLSVACWLWTSEVVKVSALSTVDILLQYDCHVLCGLTLDKVQNNTSTLTTDNQWTLSEKLNLTNVQPESNHGKFQLNNFLWTICEWVRHMIITEHCAQWKYQWNLVKFLTIVSALSCSQDVETKTFKRISMIYVLCLESTGKWILSCKVLLFHMCTCLQRAWNI